MTSKVPRIYWDACSFISCIEQTPGRGSLLAEIAAAAESGRLIFVASTILLAEVVKLNDASASGENQADRIRDFFDNDYIVMKDVTREIALAAADVQRKYPLKPNDAIHVATALRWECECLQTYDGENRNKIKKLISCDGKISLFGRPPLKICTPYMPAAARKPMPEGSLFEDDPDEVAE